MTTKLLSRFLVLTALAFIMASCSNISISSWKNPKENAKVHKIVVWGMFEKVQYEQQFEDIASRYFTSKGLTCLEALSILTPGAKYEKAVLEKKFDSVGADGVLVVSYLGTDVKHDYVEPSMQAYPDYYYSYYNYYNYWGYPMYTPGYTGVPTGGYWATTKVLNLRANLYTSSSKNMIWSAEIAITDPEYVDEASYSVAQKIYSDLGRNQLLGNK